MSLYTAGINAAQTLCQDQDNKNLEKQIKEYLKLNYNNIKYIDFYDKKFLEIMKNIIKQPDKFLDLLDYTGYDLKDFITSAVYICPSVFTPAIIKFIKENYLKNDLENTIY